MDFDVYALCVRSPRQEADLDMGTRFDFEPKVVYPATIKRIAEVLKGAIPSELYDDVAKVQPGVNPTGAAAMLVAKAHAVPASGWKDALLHKAKAGDEQAEQARADALECSRLWFTQALQVREGKVIVHILRDPNDTYRL